MGFDPDLFAEIEKQRGEKTRTRFVNEKLRDVVMPASPPEQPDTTASKREGAPT